MDELRDIQKHMLKRTWLQAAWFFFFLLFSLVIPNEYLFSYGDQVHAEEIGSGETPLGNESLIYTPEEMLSFDVKDYLQQNAPHLVAYAETISHWCGYSSISPKIIITLIEYQTGLISSGQPDLNDLQKPLSSLSDSTGFSMQVKDVAAQLADTYYNWRKNQQALDQNILQNFLDEKSDVQLRTTQTNLNTLYYQLFPELSESADKQVQTTVYGATPPDTLLQLPYPVGESWNYGGSHTNSGSGSYPQSSLDFNGGSWQWGADTSDLWVVAAHGGRVVVHSSCSVEVIGSDGWSTTYYHLDNVVVETDQTVSRNTPLANYADNSAQALCQGGSSTGPHLHFSLKYDGSYEHLDGVKLSGFSVHTGRDSYDDDCDYFWLEKNGTNYCAWTNLENPGVADTCSVPTSLDATDIEETSATLNWGSTSSAQRYDIRYKSTSDTSWLSTSSTTNSAMISSLTADTEYEFQVRSVCSDETSDYSASAHFTTYDGVSPKTVGETTVFSTTTDAANRRAVRYTMPEDGTIESITMYHKAGSGNMILGIYDGEDDPVNLLGKTDSEAVSGSDGWQTVALQSPVFVSGGETIWLAWVLETNDGILVYEAGDDPRSDAGVGWSDGMPDSFGSSSLDNYDYSIYASFTPGTTQACGVPSSLDATDIEDTTATLNWGIVSSAQRYDIRYKETSDSSWTSTTSSTNSKAISGLTAASEYEFQVRAVCSDGTSDYSSSASFTTSGTTQACSVPSRLNATNITENSATLTWSGASSATGYRIQYRAAGAGTWTTITSSSPSADINGLAAGTQYEFQIQTVCSSGDSDYSDAITFTTLSGGETSTVGNTDIYDTTTSASNRRAVSYTMPEDGTVQSITMYHKAGSGNMILAVYEGESEPTNLLGKSETVTVAETDGWQTVDLTTPVFVSEGSTIWLAWVLEENSGILVYESGSIPRADAGEGWSAGMPDQFGSSSLANYSYSIYATYEPGGTQDCAVPSGLEATDITQTSAVLRWDSVSSATGYLVQYRQLGEDWTTTTTSGTSEELTDLSSDTLYEFQVQAICSVDDSQYSSIVEFATEGEQTSEIIGHTTVFDTITDVSNRRAVQYTMPSSGIIESITMYHLAGTGDMILAVYEGDSSPTNLLAKTDSVQVDGRDGWQTVNLQTPIHVDSGKKIWLAWVLEENPGIIVYRAGSEPRAHAVWGRWSAGMPDSFGYSRLANYDYSIYATYIHD